MTTLSTITTALEGHRIYGGCDRCDAYQTMAADPIHDGVFHITVHHDGDCTELQRHENRAARRARRNERGNR